MWEVIGPLSIVWGATVFGFGAFIVAWFMAPTAGGGIGGGAPFISFKMF
jgi:phage shock protein PspC (stress-responsive transcriptional regulator)